MCVCVWVCVVLLLLGWGVVVEVEGDVVEVDDDLEVASHPQWLCHRNRGSRSRNAHR